MNLRDTIIERILSVTSSGFDELALDVFRFQYNNNTIYRHYCELMGRIPDGVTIAEHIPHIPIGLFKHNLIKTNDFEPEIVFESSTTTGQSPSQHAVRSLALYRTTAVRGFENAFNEKVSSLKWFGLLPSYLERQNASLVYMVDDFINRNGGGFYISDYDKLAKEILKCEEEGTQAILIGVSFALLDFAKYIAISLKSTRIVETGGMKGKRQELTRTELHDELKAGFGVDRIYSEYGMTELLSQAWSAGGNAFIPSSMMRVRIREIADPLAYVPLGVRGAINITDLANIDSCSFIATDDAGILYSDNSFAVLGRLDGSEQRGCNLMFGN